MVQKPGEISVNSGMAAGAQGAEGGRNFYRLRDRIYTSLLVFVVIAGLPLISLPAWRHRLSDRIHTLRQAMAGGVIKPATARVGENKEPFPSEYERKAVLPSYPKLPPYFAASRGFSGPIVSGEVVSPSPSPARKNRSIRIPATKGAAEAEDRPAAANVREAAADQAAAGADAQPKYQQGQMEEEAYKLLLQSNPKIGGLVQGSDGTLKFKSWDALKRDEDTYWVRLTFASLKDKSDQEYIWQVKLLAKQVTPMSYNARALSNP